jgi:2-phosphoglycerate kinase
MTKPAVVLIGADKGGVGKTMVARTLLEPVGRPRSVMKVAETT